MYESATNDFLMTYDPDYLEQHSDSSSFEDPFNVPPVTSKSGKHNLLNKKLRMDKSKRRHDWRKRRVLSENKQCKDVSGDAEVLWKIDTVRSSKLLFQNKPEQDTDIKQNNSKEAKSKNKNRGDDVTDQLDTNQSKRSLLRHKVIPCLSSIFGRSNHNSRQMATIKENQHENAPRDNGCQVYCASCERKRIRKFNRRQKSYAVQPVYAVEANLHEIPVPFSQTKHLQVPLSPCNRTTKNQYSSCSLTSSTDESEEIMQEKQKKIRRKLKKKLEKEIRKEYLRHHLEKQQLKEFEQEYSPGQRFMSSYQVSTYDCQTKNAATSFEGTTCCNELPSSSSKFWDFLFDKFNRKYQAQSVETKPCYCNSPKPPCSPDTCKKFDQKQSPSNTNCTCNFTPPLSDQKLLPQNANDLLKNLPRGSALPSPKKKGSAQKVQCKCYPEKGRAPASVVGSKSALPPNDVNKPCQEPHDELGKMLKGKYNGEILCIHNPPCVLINGCLNLPPPKDNSMSVWPVTQSKRNSFYHVYRKMKPNKKCEQTSQYHPPCTDIQQFTGIQQQFTGVQQQINGSQQQFEPPECKSEKTTQSICHHNPPCEVVRCCYKTSYEPKLESSCVHVPMCQTLPTCMIGHENGSNKSCDHNPRCTEIPVCTKNYIALTAKDNASTQVKPKTKMVCRHEPPCIMIPKCLGRAIYDGYIPYDAVPDCAHQPLCEMIPACCRKTNKDMVSVHSQYPGSCRVV